MNHKWNGEQANQLLRAALAEIDELGDKLSPARAEALLDEFEHDVCGAFLRQDMSIPLVTAGATRRIARRLEIVAEPHANRQCTESDPPPRDAVEILGGSSPPEVREFHGVSGGSRPKSHNQKAR
jgi:hypothetical protein